MYIGQTIQSLNNRIRMHKYNSKYKAESYFHKALGKYGVDGFNWIILNYVYGSEILDKAERFWIAYYKTMENGYNHREGGARGKISDETREKLRKAKVNQIVSEETKKRLSLANSGRPLSKEHKIKIGLANKGKKRTPEVIEKCRQANLGRIPWNKGVPCSNRTKGKISCALKGNKNALGHSHPQTEETKKKIRCAMMGKQHNLGHHLSPETKAKISRANKGRPMPEAHKQRLIQISKTRVCSLETRRKLSIAGKGREDSPEVRLKKSRLNQHRYLYQLRQFQMSSKNLKKLEVTK